MLGLLFLVHLMEQRPPLEFCLLSVLTDIAKSPLIVALTFPFRPHILMEIQLKEENKNTTDVMVLLPYVRVALSPLLQLTPLPFILKLHWSFTLLQVPST